MSDAQPLNNVVSLQREKCLRSGCWLAKIAQVFREADREGE